MTVIGVGITSVQGYGVAFFDITSVGRKINHCSRANVFLMEWTKAFRSLPNQTWARQQRDAKFNKVKPGLENQSRVVGRGGSDYLIVTQMPIKGGDELYLDYNSLPWFIYPEMPWYKKCDEQF